MQAVILLLLVVLLSLLVTRVATVALTVTGLPKPAARFQARSALTGVGFTTSEAESVTNHPVRRRIVMTLMLLSNVGVVTAMAGLLGTYVEADTGAGLRRSLLLVLGLAVIYWLSRSAVVDRNLSRLIGRLLNRYTDLEIRDYERLLHLAGEYSIKELFVDDGSWLANRSLASLRLRDEGVFVLGVTKPDGTYVGVPGRETVLRPGDALIVYGRDSTLLSLATRTAGYRGDEAHRLAATEQRGMVAADCDDARPSQA